MTGTSMTTLSARPIVYRHVIFPDAAEGDGGPFNFMPEGTIVPGIAGAADELTIDEQQFVRWLFECAGLQVEDYRGETIKRRIPACLRAFRAESIQELGSKIRRDPELLRKALGTLLIGVTTFFRDAPVFSYLAETALPDMLSRETAPSVWSAGCSDGAELYSVAMLLAERGAVQRCTLLGTDCRLEAVTRARDGTYDAAAVKAIPSELLDRYATFDGIHWRPHPYLRAVIQWRTANLLQTTEPGEWGMILCRNLSIYLQPNAAGRLWGRLAAALKPGGFLVLGKAERPYGASGLRSVAPCVYRRERS
jgi:chemotaxis protein methyltransferase CheR